MHGGSTPRSREAAAVREVSARAEVVLQRLDVAPVDDPVSALMQVTAEVVGVKDWLAARFNDADAASEYLLAEMLGRSLDRASRSLLELHRLGLAEMRVQMDEQLARGMADACRGIVSELGHDPTAPEVRALVRRHLTRIDEPAAT